MVRFSGIILLTYLYLEKKYQKSCLFLHLSPILSQLVSRQNHQKKKKKKDHEIRITYLTLPTRQPRAGKAPRTKPNRRQQMPRAKEARTQANRTSSHGRNRKERHPPSPIELSPRRSVEFEKPHLPTRRLPRPPNQPPTRQDDPDHPTKSSQPEFDFRHANRFITYIFNGDLF